jgi:hypothetical protein
MNAPLRSEAAAEVPAESSAMRQVLRRKGFPEAHFVGLWGGLGSGAACEHRGRVIESDEIEYELVFVRHAETITLRFHRECWERCADPATSM